MEKLDIAYCITLIRGTTITLAVFCVAVKLSQRTVLCGFRAFTWRALEIPMCLPCNLCRAYLFYGGGLLSVSGVLEVLLFACGAILAAWHAW